jgi:hypothetical protein
LMDNVGLWIGLGVAFGTGIGIVIGRQRKKE